MGLRVEERIVAGGDADELIVHHLTLRGSNRAIGRHLCELVRARYGVCAADPAPPRRGDCEHLRCSAAFVPPRRSASGHPLVERTFEAAGPLGRPRRGEPPPAGRPYVLELHPDDGHPSLAVCAFDLEGAALDGVNAKGLVAVAASDPGASAGVGREALLVVRRLLDGCATAAEARELLGDVHRRAAGPGRWLVADRQGDSFALELGRDGAARWLEPAGAPLALDAPAADVPLRTLWHGEYDASERRLSARFFVGAGDWRRGEAPELRFQLG